MKKINSLLSHFVLLFSLTFVRIRAISLPDILSIEDEIFKFPSSSGRPPRLPLEYVGGIPTLSFKLGTPAQDFVGIFDTASPISWVVSYHCRSKACLILPDDQKFRSEDSVTNLGFPFFIDLSYLDGTHIRFRPEMDMLTFSGSSFPPHLIGEAVQIDYPRGYQPPINARIGLGDFGSIDWFKMGLTIDDSLLSPLSRIFKKKRAVGDDRFSTGYISSGSSDFRKRGPLLRGLFQSFAWVLGVDDSLYIGSLFDLPLAPMRGLQSPFWNIPISGLDFKYDNRTNGSKSFSLPSNAYGKIYSSSPVLTVPSAIAEEMNRELGATYDHSLNLYTIPCSAYFTAPKLVFRFEGGIHAEIPPEQFIYRLERDSQAKGCYTAIVGGPDDSCVFLGGPFFRSFYLVYQFRNLKVGIAESVAETGKVYMQNTLKQ